MAMIGQAGFCRGALFIVDFCTISVIHSVRGLCRGERPLRSSRTFHDHVDFRLPIKTVESGKDKSPPETMKFASLSYGRASNLSRFPVQ